jgi:hypothetical protein
MFSTQMGHLMLITYLLPTFHLQFYDLPTYPPTLTHSQLLEGFKCESQTENIGRTRSRGMLPSSQHYRGVEGRVGTPGWD